MLAHAFQNSQVLITLDKDLGELAVVLQRPHVGIIRLVDIRAENQGEAPRLQRSTGTDRTFLRVPS